MKLKRKLKKVYLFFFGKKDYQKTVIICRSRTGSNFLISLLNKQQGIQFTGEIFRRLNGRSSLKIWNNYFSKKRSNVKQVGFKIFYDHPFDTDDRTVWNTIDADPSIKVIHLIRKNTLRSIVSRNIAEQTNDWVYNANSSKKQIKLDATTTLKEFEHTRKNELKTRNTYSSRDFLEITYEDLIENNDQVMRKVGEFLNFKYIPKTSNLRRQNKETLQDLIANFEEIHTAFQDTELAVYLNE